MLYKHTFIAGSVLLSALAGPALSEAPMPIEIGVLKPSGVRHVTAIEADKVIKTHPEVVVLDVRTPREFGESHIEGAINIDYFASDFREQIEALDKTKTYLIHCRSGRRSGKSAPIMQAAGIDNIIHMDGGFKAWQAAGLGIVEGS